MAAAADHRPQIEKLARDIAKIERRALSRRGTSYPGVGRRAEAEEISYIHAEATPPANSSTGRSR